MYNILDTICLVQMSVQYTWQMYIWQYMFKWVYNILDNVYLVYVILENIYFFQIILDSLIQMSVQYTWHYMFSSNEVYNIIDSICLVQMSVQFSWQYMFSSNECTIYLTLYV